MRPFAMLALMFSSGCLGLFVTDHRNHSRGITSTPIAAVRGPAIYVVNGGDHSIAVIDPTSNAVVGTIMLEGASVIG